MTITIQIGNSDNRLTQAEWSKFVRMMRAAIAPRCRGVHFEGAPANHAPWQNFARVVEATPKQVEDLRGAVACIRKIFRQDSAAFTVGTTEFV